MHPSQRQEKSRSEAWEPEALDQAPTRVTRDQVAELLCAETALAGLDRRDALRVVAYMVPKRVRRGALIIRQGERSATHFLLLVLDGSVEVVDDEPIEPAARVMAVLGPGEILGELSLIDGEARSASCVALTQVGVALLTRDAFQDMLVREPGVAARLLAVLLMHLGQRFRDLRRRLKVLLQINACLTRELGSQPQQT